MASHNEIKYKQAGSRCLTIKTQDGWSAGKGCDLCALTQKAFEWLEVDQGRQENYQYECYTELYFFQPIPGAVCW